MANLAVGGSAAQNWWSLFNPSTTWPTNIESINVQRDIVQKLVQYFDIAFFYDTNNDQITYLQESLYNFVTAVRSANPKLKVYGCRVPNGGINISGGNVAYNAGLPAKWQILDDAVTAGLMHGVLTVCEPGQNQYQDLGVQVSSTTTSNGSTTTLNDSGQNWKRNQWVGSWVQVGGVKKTISGNTPTQLTFAAFAGAVNTATAYTIEGNTSDDLLHPNQFGQGRFADNFKTAIDAVETVPYSIRTA